MVRRGRDVLTAHAHHEIDPDRGHGFVVRRAAAVEEAVFFHQGERIALPILAARVHHIDVSEQEHCALARGSAQGGDQIAVVRAAFGHDHAHVALGIAGGAQVRGHGFGGARAIAVRR